MEQQEQQEQHLSFNLEQADTNPVGIYRGQQYRRQQTTSATTGT